MIIPLPEWFSEEEEELKRAVLDIAQRQNINYAWVWDSRVINNSIANILNTLVKIQDNAKPEFTEEELSNFKEIKNLVEKEENIPKSYKWTDAQKKRMSETMKKKWDLRKAEQKKTDTGKFKECEICGNKIIKKKNRKYCNNCAKEKYRERKRIYQKNWLKNKETQEEAKKKYKHEYYLKNKEKYRGKKK